jgi:glycosyltransferase involved in cell wall biosynthesis
MEGGVGADMMGEIPVKPARGGDGAGSRVVFMYSGSLMEIKGVPLLLDAFSQLRSEAVELWLTGAGPLEERVREASRRDSRIRFFGSVPYSELLALYQHADVLINPHSTTHESVRYLFPSKLLEYLGTGRPVISTCSTPDIRDEYGDVLYILDEESPAALAAAMARLSAMDPSTRQAMGARGRAFVATRKSWKRQAARVAHFIASIVDT